MEGLYNYVVDYPYFFTFLVLFIGYIDYVMIHLLLTGRVVPVYKRRFPRNWETLKESIYQDITNLQTIVDVAFPFWRPLLATLCWVILICIFAIGLFPSLACLFLIFYL